MSDFRSGKTNVLITTNVLARGIDVLSVTLVSGQTKKKLSQRARGAGHACQSMAAKSFFLLHCSHFFFLSFSVYFSFR